MTKSTAGFFGIFGDTFFVFGGVEFGETTDLAVKFILCQLLDPVAGLVETGVTAIAVNHPILVLTFGAKTYLAVGLEYLL